MPARTCTGKPAENDRRFAGLPRKLLLDDDHLDLPGVFPVSRCAYVNGRYLPLRQAAVNVEDRGYQFADGV